MSSLVTVILAAGKGTRMKSDLPKVLHQILGRPMIEYVVLTALELGSDQVVLVVGHQREKVISAVSERFRAEVETGRVQFATQDPQLGTAHAVLQTKELLAPVVNQKTLVLVLSGDVPLINVDILKGMVDTHRSSSVVATMMTTQANDPTGYGRIIRSRETDRVKAIVEEKDIAPEDQETRETKEVNCGIYLFSGRELFETLPLVDNNNRQGEYYLPRVLELFLESDGLEVGAVNNPEMSENHGVNTPEQLKEVEKMMMKIMVSDQVENRDQVVGVLS